MEYFLYTEINVICIGICVILLHRLSRDISIKRERQLFMMEIGFSMALCVLDGVWALVEGCRFPGAEHVNTLLNSLYMIQTAVAGYGWYLYNENILDTSFYENRKRRIMLMLPIFILFVFVLVNLKTQCIFYIDGNNRYHRGPWYIVQPILSYSYVIVAEMRAWKKFRVEKNYVMKKIYGSLMFFAVYPTIGVLLQYIFLGAPFICVGMTFSVLTIFLNMQESQISLDHLTQLNNRNQLSRFLLDFQQNVQREKESYFILMDIDRFKKINDTYGHVEGDKALQRVADVLRNTCNSKNCFLARYGGDEFVVIYQCKHISEMEELKEQIQKNLKIANEQAGTPYQIGLSIGHTKYTDDMHAAQEAIELADIELYRAKMMRSEK